MATSTVKYSRTSSCMRWSNGEEMNISRTICVVIFRELTQFTFEWYSLFKNGDTISQKSKHCWLLSDVEGLVHHEFVSRGHSMNHTVYKMVLQCLQDAVHQKLPSKLLPVPGFFTKTMHFSQWPWMSALLAQLWFCIYLTRFGPLWIHPLFQA